MTEYIENVSLTRAIRAVKADALREAAEHWGDGNEGFPYNWLMNRANEIEDGDTVNWDAP